MEQYIIGIDIGTGSVKTVAVSLAGRMMGHTSQTYPHSHPQPGWSEQDPNQILDAFFLVLREAIHVQKQPPLAISFSSAMHSVVCVDNKGNPLTPLITWSDSRSASIAAELRNSPEGKMLCQQTGTPLHSMSPLCKIIWLRKNLSAVFEKTHRFISIKEFIWFHLFHEFEVDHSIASATGLFDIEKLCWQEQALSLAGISKERLSTPVSTDFLRYGLHASVNQIEIPDDIGFCIGASDGCLANLGTGAMREKQAALTIGTSGAIRIAGSRPLKSSNSMIFNYILEKDIFISGGPVNNGGNIVQWLIRDFLKKKDFEEHDYLELFNCAEKIVAGCGGLVFLPYLHGERAPVWDEETTGVYFGIRPFHNQDFFIRAALEGICFALKQVMENLEEAAGKIEEVQVSGGFIKSASWMQLLADITGKKLCLVQQEDASATGAAFLAMKALKRMDHAPVFPMENQKVFYPNENLNEVYKINYQVYLQLYPGLMEAMHLNLKS